MQYRTYTFTYTVNMVPYTVKIAAMDDADARRQVSDHIYDEWQYYVFQRQAFETLRLRKVGKAGK